MHNSKHIRAVAGILITLLVSINATISNEVITDENKIERIDVNSFQADNIDVQASELTTNNIDGLVMEENISNRNNTETVHFEYGTITPKTGMISVVNNNNMPENENSTTNTNVSPKTLVTSKTNTATITTHSKEPINPDLVINYAAIDSDTKIQHINSSNGKVILTIEENNNSGKQYNMINTASDSRSSDSEAKGISIISNNQNINKNSTPELEDDIRIINKDSSSLTIEKLTQPIDRRQYTRYKISDLKTPLQLENTNNGNKKQVFDISRGGVALSRDDLRIGDIVPIRIKYKDTEISTNIKIVSTTNTRAGAEFINNDKSIDNALLYLSVLLEAEKNNGLQTRFSR